MGQQQLLLLILVTVVVGIMTVVAINLFEESRHSSILEIIRQEISEAATVGQTYYKRPVMLGGGGGSFVNITLDDVSLDTANTVSNFSISETAQTYFKITADPISGLEDLTVVVYSDRIEWE